MNEGQGSGTVYFGGGNWGTPKSRWVYDEDKQPSYISKSAKENNVWVLNIQAPNYQISNPIIDKEIFSIRKTGEVIDTFKFTSTP